MKYTNKVYIRTYLQIPPYEHISWNKCNTCATMMAKTIPLLWRSNVHEAILVAILLSNTNAREHTDAKITLHYKSTSSTNNIHFTIDRSYRI